MQRRIQPRLISPKPSDSSSGISQPIIPIPVVTVSRNPTSTNILPIHDDIRSSEQKLRDKQRKQLATEKIKQTIKMESVRITLLKKTTEAELYTNRSDSFPRVELVKLFGNPKSTHTDRLNKLEFFLLHVRL